MQSSFRQTAISQKIILSGIAALAVIFYLWHLGRADIITDESSLATRAIGLVDFDFGIEQPTPWQWVDRVPWWMRLSFHDHPPLVFLLQHVSMRLFGETPFAIRLPSALAGLAAVWLVYLIGQRLYSPTVGLAAASLFAFTVNHVWISRIGLQESIAVALMLASFFCFIRALRPPVSVDQSTDTDTKAGHSSQEPIREGRWWAAAGFFLGLAFLAKYLALILIPIFLTMMILHRREFLAKHTFHVLLSLFCFLIVASPIIIYNVQLYRTFGHFDFQFSQLFGQAVEAWPSRPGQEALGSYADRLRAYVPRLIESNSPYFLILSALGLATILGQLLRRLVYYFRGRENNTPRPLPPLAGHAPLLSVFAWLFPFLIFVGPAHRFFAILTPWLAIAAGYALAAFIYSNIPRNLGMNSLWCLWLIVAAVAGGEAAYAYHSVIALDPSGPRPWTYSYLHRQAGSWGFNELEEYVAGELAGKMPEIALTFEFPFARTILDASLAAGRQQGLAPIPLAIVYNDNINLSSQLWVFLRRIVYQGWPVMSAEQFRTGGQEFLKSSGVRSIIFVNATPAALQDRTRPPTLDGDIMAAELNARGFTPDEIKNPRGETAFRIYRFDLR